MLLWIYSFSVLMLMLVLDVREEIYTYIVCIYVGRSTGKWRSKFSVRSLWHIRGIAIAQQIPFYFLKFNVFDLYLVGRKTVTL